jgi:predicted transcriptional regulator
MPEEKSVAISFRVTPRFKRLLQVAASRVNRSQTNMLETLLFEYCQANGIDDTQAVRLAVDEEGVTKK